MKISELVKQLEELKEKLGDVQVILRQDGFGGHSEHLCSDVSESHYYPSEFEDGGENGNISDDVIHELVPDWDGIHASLGEMERMTCVEIGAGEMISCT